MVAKHSKRLLPYALLFIFFFAFYYNNLIYFEPFVFDENVVFYADTAFMMRYMGSFRFNKKHLLFSPVVNPLVRLTRFLFSINENHAVIIVLALLAAINIVLAYAILKLFIKKERICVSFSIFYGFAFSNLIFFSIPETYVLTDLMILIYLCCLIRFKSDLTFKKIILLSIIIGLGSLSNPPLFLLLVPNCYILYKLFNIKRFVLLSFVCTLISCVIFVLSNVAVQGGLFFNYCQGFAYRSTISMLNFTKYSCIINVFTSFLFFSVISPLDTLANSTGIQNFLGYFNSPIRVILILTYFFYLYLAGCYVIRNRNIIIDSFLLLILSMMSFYVYFVPTEAMVYSSQILFPITLILASVFNNIKFKRKYLFFNIFLVIMLMNNSFCMYTWILEKGSEKNVTYIRTKGILRQRISDLQDRMPYIRAFERRGRVLLRILKDDNRKLKQFLREREITYGYAEGVPLVTFKIDERISATGDEDDNYIGERLTVDSLADPAYILLGKEAFNFYQQVRGTGGNCKHESLGPFHVYHNFTAPHFDREAISPSKWQAFSNYNQKDVTNAFDGDIDTRWTTGKFQRGGMYYEIDLGRIYEVNGICMLFPGYLNDYPCSYRLDVSLDGEEWRSALLVEKVRGSWFWLGGRFFWRLGHDRRDIWFIPTSARFLRITTQTGIDENYWTVQEILVFKATERRLENAGDFSALIDFLDGKNIKHVYTDECLSARLTHETHGRIKTLTQYYYYSREKRMFLKFSKEEWDKLPVAHFEKDTAVVLTGQSAYSLESALDKYGMKRKKTEVGVFNVYHDIIPSTSGKTLSRDCFTPFSSHNSSDCGKAIDGDMESRWATQCSQEPGMYYGLDLGRVVEVCGVRLYHGKTKDEYPRKYEIAVSQNGENWKNVNYFHSGPYYWTGFTLLKMGHSQGKIEIGFPSISARYIKIIQTGYDPAYYWSIHELEVIAK